MLLPSLLGAAATALSLGSLTRASPQGFGGGSDTFASSVASAVQSVTSAVVPAAAAAATGTIACNNSPLLCNRDYNNITHMGAHDVAFLRDSTTGFSTSGNSFYNATLSLSAGIRLLQAQVHWYQGALKLCHTSCLLLDGGTLVKWLAEINYWMSNNPNEVVTILLVNSDNNSTATYGSVFSSSGISQYGYTPASTTAAIATWPTLQTLITANKRLVTFVTNMDYSSTYPYLLPEFTYLFETAYGQTSVNDFNCTLDRPSTVTSAASGVSSGYLPLVNHFLGVSSGFGLVVPDVSNLAITNSNSTTVVGALGTHALRCQTEWGIKPTFMLTDFSNVGPAISTADNINGITGQISGRTVLPSGVLSATTSSADRNKLTMGLLAAALGGVGAMNLLFF